MAPASAGETADRIAETHSEESAPDSVIAEPPPELIDLHLLDTSGMTDPNFGDAPTGLALHRRPDRGNPRDTQRFLETAERDPRLPSVRFAAFAVRTFHRPREPGLGLPDIGGVLGMSAASAMKITEEGFSLVVEYPSPRSSDSRIGPRSLF